LLCYLEGQTRDEAAAALGVTPGTVKGRVRRGCELLRRQLARRGVSLAVGLLAATAPRPVTAGPPAAEIAAATHGPLPPRVAELVRELTRTTVLTMSRLVVLGVFALVGVAVPGLVPGPNPDPPHPLVRAAAPVPVASAPPATFLVKTPGLEWLDADGKEKEKFDPPAYFGIRSPNGGKLAALESDTNTGRARLVMRSGTAKGEPVEGGVVFGAPARSGCGLVWSADSKRLSICEETVTGEKTREFHYQVYDLAAKTLTRLNLPDGYWITDWSADGKRFLADVRPSDTTVRVAWIKADGTGKPEFISPEKEFGYQARLSPDGGRVLYMGGTQSKPGERAKTRLYVQDLATGKRTAVDEEGETHGHCWSRDGTRVAYTWQRPLDNPEKVPVRETLLITVDPDGRNRKVVTSRKYEVPENSSGRTGVVWFFSVIDWR
jgi:hypothetical protein